MANLFREIGSVLVNNGYDLVLIRSGEKRPALGNWTRLKVGLKDVREWAESHPRANIGIQTRHTPAVDIDVYDEDLAREMREWVIEHMSNGIDPLPVRVGKAPKSLILFRADKPFQKMKSIFVDDAGQEHAVEILGDGQQFVAFGIHPDTKKPFEWITGVDPTDLDQAFLRDLSAEDAERIIKAWETLAKKHGLKPKKGASKAMTRTDFGDEHDEGDDLLSISGRVEDLDEEDIRDALSLVDGHEDYDRWVQVGMALHHQFDGDEKGLELWHDWSAEASNYDADVLNEKWESFSVVRSHGKATTLRVILAWAKEGAKIKAKDEFSRLSNLIESTGDVDELFDGVVRECGKVTLLPHQFEKIAAMIQTRAKDIDGVKMPLGQIRTLLTKQRSSGLVQKDDVPEWVKDFVWLESDDSFYSLAEYKMLSVKSYNARYDRHMLSAEDKAMGNAIPAVRAADAALTTHEMRHVDGKVYLPGFDRLVQLDDGSWRVNIYDSRSIPEPSKPKTQDQKDALAAVKRHLEVLYPNERERALLTSFLAYQVQFPSERVNFAVLVQGAEGAGKTWTQNLMAAVLGRANVGPVNPSSLFADFNGWAEGRKMIFIEEIRLRGENRYEALEKIKTNITNDTLEITKKGKDPYSSPNVTSYMMFTNYADALDLTANDRRYFVLKTSFQSKPQIDRFTREHPNHFTAIFDAVAEHPDVMRWWLMNYKLHDEFDPKGHAPWTSAKDHMRALSKTNEQDGLEDMLSSGKFLDCSDYLLNVTELPERLADADVAVPQTYALKAMLDRMGFVFLGRVKVDGGKARFYTRRPDLFTDDEHETAMKVRAILSGEEPEFI